MTTYEEETLQDFCAAQRLAVDVLHSVAARLREGDTEEAVAWQLKQSATARGAQGFFHEPLVWFGPRTASFGERSALESLPGSTRLEQGMPVIMDMAPVFEGCAVDVSHTCALGHSALVQQGRGVLAGLRSGLEAQLAQGATGRGLCTWVRDRARDAGWKSVQEQYLMGALAHRVFRIPRLPLGRKAFAGLGWPAGVALFGRALMSRVPLIPVAWPFWNDSKHADSAPAPGLWSFEPHFVKDGVGVKWEELLVIDRAGARWLDPVSPLVD